MDKFTVWEVRMNILERVLTILQIASGAPPSILDSSLSYSQQSDVHPG
jgi:hypothetical protein